MFFSVKNLSISIILCFVFSTFADSVRKMAPPSRFDTTKLISELVQTQQTRQLNTDETNKLFLLKFLNEVLELEKFSVYIRKPIQPMHIVNELEKMIYYKGAWTKELTTIQMTRLESDKASLRKLLGDDSISWAWVQNKTGETKYSKDIIKRLFEEQFKKTMALKIAHYGLSGPGPMGYSVQYLEFLLELSSEKEKAAVKEKLRRMKLHISKIPQSRIVT